MQNFAGMPEEQFVALPPEVRQMAMASANTVMNNSMAGPGMMQGPNGGMMQPNMPMMHDMGQMGMHMGQMGPGMNMPMGPGMGQMGPQGMGPQGMGPQGMGPSNMGQMGPMQGGMNGPGDMVQMGQGGPMMPDGQGVNMQGQGQGQGQGEGEGGFNQGPQGMMMGGEYPMQVIRAASIPRFSMLIPHLRRTRMAHQGCTLVWTNHRFNNPLRAVHHSQRVLERSPCHKHLRLREVFEDEVHHPPCPPGASVVDLPEADEDGEVRHSRSWIISDR